MFEAWMSAQAIVPFAVIAIALFTFITMLALIANTNSIDKKLYKIQEHLEKQAEKENQGGNDLT